MIPQAHRELLYKVARTAQVMKGGYTGKKIGTKRGTGGKYAYGASGIPVRWSCLQTEQEVVAEHNIPFSFFWEVITYPPRRNPLFEGGVAQEEDFPWRRAVSHRSAPFSRKALAVGKWTGSSRMRTWKGSQR
jgi:hypothetical protein